MADEGPSACEQAPGEGSSLIFPELSELGCRGAFCRPGPFVQVMTLMARAANILAGQGFAAFDLLT
ncbi:MAG TPA: hypothetical protein VHK03_04390, partial [Aestuariivirgaceae bacterium]|nr:hypothetical protein [Aestuariivirgaceae bacterium]